MSGTGPLAALAFIASVLLGTIAVIVAVAALSGKLIAPLALVLLGIAMLAGAALLLLPPLWRLVTAWWLNGLRVALAFGLACSALFVLPISSHAVVRLPPSHTAP